MLNYKNLYRITLSNKHYSVFINLKILYKINFFIKKILDRKNNELEKLKKDHRSKTKDNEELINSLERKR